MEFVPVVGLVALVWKFVDLLKDVTARNWNGVTTVFVGWLSGIGGVALVAQTQFADQILIGDRALGDFGGWDILVVGLLFTTMAGAAYDIKKAVDGSDSAVTPKLTSLNKTS